MATDIRHKELIRGKLLYYLKLIYPNSATLPLLQGELDIFGYPVPLEDLNFHIAYLIEKGYVAADNVRGPHSNRRIALVKITAKGIDLLDGRLAADEGIYLAPSHE
ncbi:MAG TPA: hypothetical protein VFD30_21570 [Terriglobia bacterium]|jgi:hypothetical protein|nr:hypothetical protein [Terriglobia bacterium]